jgi:hypothetical protein
MGNGRCNLKPFMHPYNHAFYANNDYDSELKLKQNSPNCILHTAYRSEADPIAWDCLLKA